MLAAECWMRLGFGFAVVLTLGCGGQSGDSGPGTGSPRCEDGQLRPSVVSVGIEFDGERRSYQLHVPASYDGSTPVPVVLNFHGLTQTGELQREQSKMDRKSDEEGFIVVYPNGVSNAWNSGGGISEADDVGFARAVIDDVAARGCIDRKRVYATGMSNGGQMSHRLACEAADVIAAVAPHSGGLRIDPSDCRPSRPIPILHFHGENDTIASFESIPADIATWARLNECTDESEVTFQQGDVTCTTRSQCKDGVSVTLCAASDAGHCWFGYECPVIGSVNLGGDTTSINANDAMWALFETVELP
jgi:polyhydroxybutyrate depolymerase